MKTKIVHLYGPSKFHTYGTVCGLFFNSTYKDTILKENVTCKNCKKTKSFRGVK